LFSLYFSTRAVVPKTAFPKNPEQKLRKWNIPSKDPQMPAPDSINELLFPSLADTAVSRPSEIECEIMGLYGRFRDPLLRYALSLGIPYHDGEEVIQEAFLSLFRHLQLGRPRANLRGWLFRVTHNLGLKQLYANYRSDAQTTSDWTIAKEQIDPSPNPEEEILSAQRRHRLLAVVHALPEADQCCLRLRAEGLRYREIAAVLGISLGAVSISLTQSLTRLIRADGR
jgi:RNA polymerase sigma-70 factor, ECF subfamily